MVKKKVLSLFSLIALFIIGFSFILSGCASASPTSKEMYKKIDSFFLEEIFSTESFITSGATPNQLKDFEYYFDETTKQTADENYLILTEIALDFIYEYSSKLNIKDNFDYTKLNESFTAFKSAFYKAEEDYQNFVNAKNNKDIVIYNGFFVKYQSSCKNFIESAYDFALEMKNVLGSNLKLYDINFESISKSNSDVYLAKLKLEIANDFKEILFDSFKGERFDGLKSGYVSNDIYNSVTNLLETLNSIKNLDITTGLGDEFVNLNTAYLKLQESREMLNNAVKNFNMYDFIKKYNCSLERYKLEKENAEIYYNLIKQYFAYSEVVEGQEYKPLYVMENMINMIKTIYA